MRIKFTGNRAAIAAVATVAALSGSALATGVVDAGGARPQASVTDATAAPAGVFVAVSPLRVLDTRPAPYGPIGVASPGKLGPDKSMDVALAGEGRAIPANATSALLNITIDESTTIQSFVTVWPSGEPRPNSSANNALPGLVASNSIVAKLGTNGSISIYNQTGNVDVVVDLVGYLLPLAEADAPGAQLASGSGAPANTVGNDGDFYLDRDNGILYGPKTDGAYPIPGIELGGADGAASAYDDTPVSLALTGLDPVAVAFDTAGPADGTVARTDSTTFTVSEDGLYTVAYDLTVTGAVPGSISVVVGGTPQGPSETINVVTTEVSANAILVDAAAGDTIQLIFTPTLIGASLDLGSASIVVTQATQS